MSDPFGRRLRDAVASRGPLCVGIDPHPGLLAQWGLPDDADGLCRFADIVLEAVAGEVAAVKAQSAFFERHGAAGIEVLEHTVRSVRAAGALVLLDAKRGDIGSTASAYADAYLRPDAPLAVDALTVSPYLGFESLRPFLDLAAETGSGVFVLALTSNPEGGQVQRARTPQGHSVAGELLAAVAAENAATAPDGSVGVVIGATLAVVDASLGETLDVGGPLLAPGVGAQGATAADVARLFAGVRDRVLPAVSRGVLVEGPTVERIRAAARRHRDELADALFG